MVMSRQRLDHLQISVMYVMHPNYQGRKSMFKHGGHWGGGGVNSENRKC